MSADTYIYIGRKYKGKRKVWLCVASCVCRHKKHCLQCQKLALIGEAKNEKEIRKLIKKTEDEALSNGSYIEYGVSYKLWCK